MYTHQVLLRVNYVQCTGHRSPVHKEVVLYREGLAKIANVKISSLQRDFEAVLDHVLVKEKQREDLNQNREVYVDYQSQGHKWDLDRGLSNSCSESPDYPQRPRFRCFNCDADT